MGRPCQRGTFSELCQEGTQNAYVALDVNPVLRRRFVRYFVRDLNPCYRRESEFQRMMLTRKLAL